MLTHVTKSTKAAFYYALLRKREKDTDGRSLQKEKEDKPKREKI